MLRPTVQSASLSWNKAPIWGLRPEFYYCQTVADLWMWGALSDERTGLQFTIAVGPRQRRHVLVRGSPNLGPDPRIYIPQEQRGPIISPGTGFPFRRLLRLAGLRWES
jgi:hypothetical protein